MTKELLEALRQLPAAVNALAAMADNIKLLAIACIACAGVALLISLRK